MVNYNDIGQQVINLHNQLRIEWPQLRRIALALYDTQTDELHTFVNATVGQKILPHYTQKLADVPSLQKLAQSGKKRIVDDLNIFASNSSQHSEAIVQSGFRSSFTIPMLSSDNTLQGFIFFDADEPSFFTSSMQEHLELYSELIHSLVIADMLPVKMLQAAVNISQTVTHYRDEETGEHIARMSHYARLIASSMAEKWNLSDAFINYVLLYAPLHDIGKIAIPDTVLLKPGSLDEAEMVIMKTHVAKGVEIIEKLIYEFGLGSAFHTSILTNIVAYHHEKMDGSGYPYSLKGDSIPIESKIVAVADVFDALTSNRPYRKSWSIDQAFDYLSSNKEILFDTDCVELFISKRLEIEKIITLFSRIT